MFEAIMWIVKAVWYGLHRKDIEAQQILTAELAHESRMMSRF